MNQRSSGAPTIIDVAKKAGVSIKTVSRVMNNEPNVQAKTRELVMQVVAELNYRPKLSARSLAGARSFIIGMLYYDPSLAYVASVQHGATMRCREADYHLVVESIENNALDIRSRVQRMVAALRPDGVILTPPICDNREVIDALLDTGTPTVLIAPGEHTQGLPAVAMDDVGAAQEVTNLLIGLGHKRIGFVEGPTDQAAAARRRRGFEQAMQAHGLAMPAELIVQGDFRFQSGVEAAHHLLSRRNPPTAVFASNDDMALGLLAAAQQLGVQVPEDLSIVGFDDFSAASLVWPPLTTVRQPLFEMACAAVDLLIGRERPPLDDGTPASPRLLPHQLLVRHSTAAPRKRTKPHTA